MGAALTLMAVFSLLSAGLQAQALVALPAPSQAALNFTRDQLWFWLGSHAIALSFPLWLLLSGKATRYSQWLLRKGGGRLWLAITGSWSLMPATGNGHSQCAPHG
jgi:hypothetical protein